MDNVDDNDCDYTILNMPLPKRDFMANLMKPASAAGEDCDQKTGMDLNDLENLESEQLEDPGLVDHMKDMREIETLTARLAVLVAKEKNDRYNIIVPELDEYKDNREKFSHLVHDVDDLQSESNVIFDLICAKKYDNVLKMEKSYVKLIKEIKASVLVLRRAYDLTRQ
jgi:hypothetical protein